MQDVLNIIARSQKNTEIRSTSIKLSFEFYRHLLDSAEVPPSAECRDGCSVFEHTLSGLL